MKGPAGRAQHPDRETKKVPQRSWIRFTIPVQREEDPNIKTILVRQEFNKDSLMKDLTGNPQQLWKMLLKQLRPGSSRMLRLMIIHAETVINMAKIITVKVRRDHRTLLKKAMSLRKRKLMSRMLQQWSLLTPGKSSSWRNRARVSLVALERRKGSIKQARKR